MQLLKDALMDDQKVAGKWGKAVSPRAMEHYLASLIDILIDRDNENIVFRCVSGDAICGGCGAPYKAHGADDEFPFFTRACLGQLVKL